MFQTTQDLDELDKQRREEFKEYEMEKDFEKKKHLEELPEEERKKEEERLKELEKKHKEHPKVHHPVSFLFSSCLLSCFWAITNKIIIEF